MRAQQPLPVLSTDHSPSSRTTAHLHLEHLDHVRAKKPVDYAAASGVDDRRLLNLLQRGAGYPPEALEDGPVYGKCTREGWLGGSVLCTARGAVVCKAASGSRARRWRSWRRRRHKPTQQRPRAALLTLRCWSTSRAKACRSRRGLRSTCSVCRAAVANPRAARPANNPLHVRWHLDHVPAGAGAPRVEAEAVGCRASDWVASGFSDRDEYVIQNWNSLFSWLELRLACGSHNRSGLGSCQGSCGIQPATTQPSLDCTPA